MEGNGHPNLHGVRQTKTIHDASDPYPHGHAQAHRRCTSASRGKGLVPDPAFVCPYVPCWRRAALFCFSMLTLSFFLLYSDLTLQTITFSTRSGCSDLTSSITFCPSSCVGKRAKESVHFPHSGTMVFHLRVRRAFELVSSDQRTLEKNF